MFIYRYPIVAIIEKYENGVLSTAKILCQHGQANLELFINEKVSETVCACPYSAQVAKNDRKSHDTVL